MVGSASRVVCSIFITLGVLLVALSVRADPGSALDVWQRACSTGGEQGLCVRVSSLTYPAGTCGSRKGVGLEVMRAPVSPWVREALRRAARPRNKDADQRRRAQQALIDMDLEDYLRLPPLPLLDFDPQKPAVVEKSKKAFADWLRLRTRASVDLSARLSQVKGRPGFAHHRAIALYGSFASAIEHSRIPSNVSSGTYAADLSNAYCDALADAAKPLHVKHDQALAGCKGLEDAGWSAACAAIRFR